MCNIAGYIGNRPAAPILLEMMAKESGFGGGYYTGIATLHEGKLYYAKVAGDMDRLLGETNAASLPGNIGFIHSRSFGRQNMEWAHPFISDRGRLAYIANGFNGVFENLELFNSYCKQMLDEGFTFRTATTENIGYNTPRLSDGSGIHGSELAAHMITSEYRKEKDFGLAMMKSMVKRPTEIVGLALHEDFEDTIFISRFNFPMMTARAEGEMFLATAAMVFPKDRNYYSYEPIPCMSQVEVTVDGFRARSFDPMPMSVKSIDAFMWKDAYDLCVKELKKATPENPESVGGLIEKTKYLWPEGMLNQDAMLIYEIMRALDEKGLLKIVTVPDEGPAEGIKTYHFRLYMD